MKYMSEDLARSEIVKVGKYMFMKNLVAANDGNISVRLSEDSFLMTPTGVSKGELSEEMLVKLDFDLKVLAGDLKASSEVKMHLEVYRQRADLAAVCHAHPPAATAYAIAGIALDQAIYPEAMVNLGVVPVARYASPGSKGVAESIKPFLSDYNACLLANHGALTWGRDLTEAWYRMDSLENYAKILMYTEKIIGQTRVLSASQILDILEIRENLGVSTGGIPSGSTQANNTQDNYGSLPDYSPEELAKLSKLLEIMKRNSDQER